MSSKRHVIDAVETESASERGDVPFTCTSCACDQRRRAFTTRCGECGRDTLRRISEDDWKRGRNAEADERGSSAGPDLSALDNGLRRRIDVAVVRGAEWTDAGELWADELCVALTWMDGTIQATHMLPDPENDPTAAWELMVSERISLLDMTRGWAARAKGCANSYADSPGRAVVDAFLAKHASPR